MEDVLTFAFIVYLAITEGSNRNLDGAWVVDFKMEICMRIGSNLGSHYKKHCTEIEWEP